MAPSLPPPPPPPPPTAVPVTTATSPVPEAGPAAGRRGDGPAPPRGSGFLAAFAGLLGIAVLAWAVVLAVQGPPAAPAPPTSAPAAVVAPDATVGSGDTARPAPGGGSPIAPEEAASRTQVLTVDGPLDTTRVGTCRTFDDDDPIGSRVAVPCDDVHRTEVAAVVDLTERGAPPSYPSAEVWAQAGEAICTEVVAEYLGHAPVMGRDRLAVLKPSQARYLAGDRAMVCEVGAVDPVEGWARIDEPVAVRQGLVGVAPGECLAVATPGTSDLRPSSCDEPHEFDVIAAVPLLVDDPAWPERQTQFDLVGTACDEAFAPFAAADRVAVVFPVSGARWAAGDRRVLCLAAVLDADREWTVRRSALERAAG